MLRSFLIALAIAAFAAPSLAGRAFISNEKGNSVTVIDTETLEVIETVPVGVRPRGIILSPSGHQLYVCTSDMDHVEVYDPETMELLHTLPSGPDPELFVLHPSGNPLYIANEDDNIVTVVDVETRSVVAQIDVGIEPEGMAVSPDGRIAITTSETTNMAHWIDTETEEIFANTLVDNRPRHAEFVKDGAELWVSAEIGGTVSVFTVEDQVEKNKITFDVQGVHPDKVQPGGFKVTGDGKTAFVALGPSNRVGDVNTETYEVEDYILVGRRVWHMAFSPDGTQLFTTNGVSGDVTVIDVALRKAIKSIKVGRFPWGAAARP